jgi:hypothetical protein
VAAFAATVAENRRSRRRDIDTLRDMASIHREIAINVSPATAWSAMRDIGALHTRLVRGFVTDCRLDGDSRLVTFANGMTVRELIVDVDDERRRVVWSAIGARLTHHNASAQVVDDAAGCRVIWIADLLPNEMAPAIAAMIDQGMAAMKRTLEEDA